MHESSVVSAVKLIIMTGDWDRAGEFADENHVVDCLRCFAEPRKLRFDNETQAVYLCLFCASCWYAHERHRDHKGRRKYLAQCEVCNVVGHHRSMDEALALKNLHTAERRFLYQFGWMRNPDNTWDPPKDQNFKYKSGYTHNHAVNALKQRVGLDNQKKQPRNPNWQLRTTTPHDD